MPSLFVHGHTLLIGVGESAYSKWSLPVTVKDAQALRAILTDANLCAYPDDNDHVRLLCDANATRSAVLDGLAWLRAQAATDPEATAVVYYSGHGWLERPTGRYYLLPHDIEPFDIPGSALSAQVFTSSRGEQKSWVRPDRTMSIYTYHLIEALQGAGNQPADTAVRVSNLMSHLGRTVPESARKLCHAEQTPFFDAATEDFPVAMLRGGKGLPSGGWEDVRSEASATISRVVHAIGERSVAIGDDVTGGTIITGDVRLG